MSCTDREREIEIVSNGKAYNALKSNGGKGRQIAERREYRTEDKAQRQEALPCELAVRRVAIWKSLGPLDHPWFKRIDRGDRDKLTVVKWGSIVCWEKTHSEWVRDRRDKYRRSEDDWRAQHHCKLYRRVSADVSSSDYETSL